MDDASLRSYTVLAIMGNAQTPIWDFLVQATVACGMPPNYKTKKMNMSKAKMKNIDMFSKHISSSINFQNGTDQHQPADTTTTFIWDNQPQHHRGHYNNRNRNYVKIPNWKHFNFQT